MKNFKKIRNAYVEDTMKISLYKNKNIYDDDSDTIVDLIHENLNEIENDNNKELSMFFLKKIMPREKIMKELLTYDLLNYCPSRKVESFDEFVNVCIKSLKKFQWKVGGYNLEDKDWILNDKENKRFKIKENQKILYNTTEKKYCDKELLWFLENVLEYLRKYVDENKFTIKYNWIEDERFEICWIIIILTDKTKMNK